MVGEVAVRPWAACPSPQEKVECTYKTPRGGRISMWNYQCAWKFYLFCRMYSYVEKYCESTCGGVHTVLQRQASCHHNVFCHNAQLSNTQHSLCMRFIVDCQSSNHLRFFLNIPGQYKIYIRGVIKRRMQRYNGVCLVHHHRRWAILTSLSFFNFIDEWNAARGNEIWNPFSPLSHVIICTLIDRLRYDKIMK